MTKSNSAIDAVLYAKDLSLLTQFYAEVLSVQPTHVEATHVVLSIGDARLYIHAIPTAYAESILIASPPELREDAAIKLSFGVDSLSSAREIAIAQGGGTAALEHAWEHEGVWHLAAWDPEGNVFQLCGSARA